MHNFGLKLGSTDTQYTEDIIRYYDEGVFQYIELFAVSGTFDRTVSYWKQFDIPFGIHAPHSAAGMNLSLAENREINKPKIEETLKFADALDARYIVFHAGTNGTIEEATRQLLPYADERFLIENKPIKGLDGSRCVGTTYDELLQITKELKAGFCLDFGHAICAANTLQEDAVDFIKKLLELSPRLFHLTDGDYKSEMDSHLHYGKGNFPLAHLLNFVPNGMMITNEAKRDDLSSLREIAEDARALREYIV